MLEFLNPKFDPRRRAALKLGVGALATVAAVELGPTTDAEGKEHEYGPITPTPEQEKAIKAYEDKLAEIGVSPLHGRIRDDNAVPVPVSEVLAREVPLPLNISELLPGGTGLLVLPEQDVYYLFKGGIKIKHGPVITGADNMPTPSGMFRVYRVEDEKYTSKQYSPAKMPWASFFQGGGKAIHGSARIVVGPDGSLVMRGESHGCIGVPFVPGTEHADAQEIQKALAPEEGKLGGTVLIVRATKKEDNPIIEDKPQTEQHPAHPNEPRTEQPAPQAAPQPEQPSEDPISDPTHPGQNPPNTSRIK